MSKETANPWQTAPQAAAAPDAPAADAWGTPDGAAPGHDAAASGSDWLNSAPVPQENHFSPARSLS